MGICDKAEVGHGSNKISFSNGDMKPLSTALVPQMFASLQKCTVDSIAFVWQQWWTSYIAELLGCMSEEDKELKSKGIHWIEAITMHCVWPPREDWSISHCNEVAHRLHQRQGVYRFNLYNECNLLLSTTCSSPDMDLAMACRDQTQGGPDKCARRVCMYSMWEEGRCVVGEEITLYRMLRWKTEGVVRSLSHLCWCRSCM